MSESNDKWKKPKERKLRPVSARYLDNAAMAYLGRYASSAENLKRVLERKVRKRNEGHGAASQEQAAWIDEAVAKCLRLGLVDDAQYARTRSFSMHRAGKSERMIRGTLKQKGVGEGEIDEALNALREEIGDNLERDAAISWARRRRFGPFRTVPGGDTKRRRELASFARAGFSYELSRRVVEAQTVDGLQDLE